VTFFSTEATTGDGAAVAASRERTTQAVRHAIAAA